MSDKKQARLILEDGTQFTGQSFGAETSIDGEVVFNTAMTGYPESLTDPSYRGQILVITYPLVGNYGVPSFERENGLLKFFESDMIHIRGLIISDYSERYSHWNASKSLGEWLKENDIPAVSGIDTRQLTKIIREKGVMLGRIEMSTENCCGDDDASATPKMKSCADSKAGKQAGQSTQTNSAVTQRCSTTQANTREFEDPNLQNLVAEVSCDNVETYGAGEHKIVLVDCGCKNNIIRCLIARDATVIRVPWDYDFTQIDYDGVMLSNGPGDPQQCTETIKNIKKAMKLGKPIFGICLGNQLLSIAAGATTFKLKYGHRSHNQPALMVGTNKAVITSQNHGFAVNTDSLDSDWEPYFINLNDGTSEGIRHKTKPFFSVQFHPEASSGPVDSEFLFDDFIANIEKCR